MKLKKKDETMNELGVGIALLGGMALGVFFFGGLWVTIRHLDDHHRPGMALFVSSFVRIALALGGLYVLAWGRWERLLIAVAGFMLARLVIVRALGYPRLTSPKTKELTLRGTES